MTAPSGLHPWAAIETQPEPTLKLIKVKAGTGVRISTYSTAFGGTTYFKTGPRYLNLQAGVVNYVGDIEVGMRGVGNLGISDNEAATVAEARAAFPKTFERYKIVKNLPGEQQP
jgi:hypothetical protein